MAFRSYRRPVVRGLVSKWMSSEKGKEEKIDPIICMVACFALGVLAESDI